MKNVNFAHAIRYDYCLGYNKALEDLCESLPEPPKQ